MSDDGERGPPLFRDRRTALNWGARRPRHCLVARLMLGSLKSYPEAQIRSRVLRAIFRPLNSVGHPLPPHSHSPARTARRRGRSSWWCTAVTRDPQSTARKTESIPAPPPPRGGVMYRSFCLNSGAVAVPNITSRRLWCRESLFPTTSSKVPFWWAPVALSTTVKPVTKPNALSPRQLYANYLDVFSSNLVCNSTHRYHIIEPDISSFHQSSKVPFCRAPSGLSTCSIFGRAFAQATRSWQPPEECLCSQTPV